MQTETAALVAKSAGTAGAAAAAAFGLTWWAVAAALLGAVASLHFEKPATGSTVVSVILQIFSLAILAAFLGAAVPHIPGFGWTEPASMPKEVALVVRTGLLGIFANPISNWIRSIISRRTSQGA